ncbi:MAG TPA: DUF2461 domain-containing protein [Acidimicrobiia bacterium]|nr:DUF2461 domain-containing protein [Acidimicrobiia bacterium]
MSAFNGWPAEALEFYVGLEADNSKSYWHAHRETYERAVKEPFVRLGEEVAREFGPLHVFRPYRDVRFSRDKSPYKTAAAAVTEGPGGAGYYVQLSAEGLLVASGYYVLASDQLERWRAAVADARSGPRIARDVERVRAAGYEVAGHESLKTAPRGYPKDHPRIELLRNKGLTVGRTFLPARWLHTRAAYDRIVRVWRDAAPVNRWLDRHVGPSTVAPREPA